MIRRKTPGFTLIEVIVVLGIMAILATFVVPSSMSMLRGIKLNQAVQLVEDRLTLARQTAITRNHTVEVRFYQYADPSVPGSAKRFRALQAMDVAKANLVTPLEKMQTLPSSVIIDSGTTLSSILGRTAIAGTTAIPRLGTAYSYVAIRFRPDGSTDLLAGVQPMGSSWFLTLHDEMSGDGLTTPPANFGTIEVDPVNGSLKMFRPGI